MSNEENRTVEMEVSHLKKYYKAGRHSVLKAVDDVSFQVYKGETFGLVGESGCGKTTCGKTCLGMLEKTEGQQEIWQLGLTRKYEHVVFCQGQKKENKNTTGELTIDWSLQAPCYRLQGEDLTGAGSFYGLYTVYFDGSQYSEFCKNGVSVYAYDSEESSAEDAPVEMKPSDKGNGIYEYCLDRPYEYIAFMAGTD